MHKSSQEFFKPKVETECHLPLAEVDGRFEDIAGGKGINGGVSWIRLLICWKAINILKSKANIATNINRWTRTSSGFWSFFQDLPIRKSTVNFDMYPWALARSIMLLLRLRKVSMMTELWWKGRKSVNVLAWRWTMVIPRQSRKSNERQNCYNLRCVRCHFQSRSAFTNEDLFGNMAAF